MVWQLPTDPQNSNNFLLENIYVDALRHGPAPSAYDYRPGHRPRASKKSR